MNQEIPLDFIIPCTPPPSPLGERANFFRRSESESSILRASMLAAAGSDLPKMPTSTTTAANLKQAEMASCKKCRNEEEFLVKINVIIFDKSHPGYSSVHKNLHKYLDIEFSKLKINVNPESWIILLDLLGKCLFLILFTIIKLSKNN